MTSDLMGALVEIAAAGTVAILVVALMRKPLRRVAGARVAYSLWMLVPLSAVVVALPAPSRSTDTEYEAFSAILLRVGEVGHALQDAVGTTEAYATTWLLGWALGCLALLALLIMRQRLFMRSLGRTTAIRDGVRRSANVRGPVLVGLCRPVIVLPAGFESLYSVEERAMVLAHEREHLRRGDLLVNALAMIWLCLHWFNPLAYWAVARIKFDQDLACDAAVLSKPTADRGRYAAALLKTQIASDSSCFAPIECHWQSSHPLKERITMLKNPLPSPARRLTGVLLVYVLMVVTSLALWSTQANIAHAQPGASAQDFSVTADRVSWLESGDLELNGNVVLTPLRNGGDVGIHASSVVRLDDGSLLVEGDVRISFDGGGTLTTNRAGVEENGTIRLESGRLTNASRLD